MINEINNNKTAIGGCKDCGSIDFADLKGFQQQFYKACTHCGRISRKDNFNEQTRLMRILAVVYLIAQTTIGSFCIAAISVGKFFLLWVVGYVFVWSVWNFIMSPVFSVRGFSLLEQKSFARWGLPSFLVSLGIPILLIRYLPLRLLPTIFHDFSFRRRDREGE